MENSYRTSRERESTILVILGVHATKFLPLFRIHRKHWQSMGFIRFQDSDTLSRSELILEPDTSTLEHKTAILRSTKTVDLLFTIPSMQIRIRGKL